MPSLPSDAPDSLGDATCRARRLALAALIPWGFGLACVLDQSWGRRVDPQDPWILGLMVLLAIGAWCWGRASRPAAATLELLSGLTLLAGLAMGGLWWLLHDLPIPL